uniref:Uncharacterized protein n=1 Tax=viral metagenome TaxID=1070528 RepID=A0A6M3KG18_9ZZZZ
MILNGFTYRKFSGTIPQLYDLANKRMVEGASTNEVAYYRSNADRLLNTYSGSLGTCNWVRTYSDTDVVNVPDFGVPVSTGNGNVDVNDNGSGSNIDLGMPSVENSTMGVSSSLLLPVIIGVSIFGLIMFLKK